MHFAYHLKFSLTRRLESRLYFLLQTKTHLIWLTPYIHVFSVTGHRRNTQTDCFYGTLFTKRKDVMSVRHTHYRYSPYLLTYLLTPWCRVLLEKLSVLQLVKKFPAFHRTRRFITALTSVRHLSLSWASPIQSIYPHPTSWRFILILSTHLCLGLPSGLFPSGFPTKTLYTPLSSPIRATYPVHLVLLDFITRTRK